MWFPDAALSEQTAGVGEQPAVQQARAPLAPHQAALRLLLHDGIRTSNRVHPQNTHIQARLGPHLGVIDLLTTYVNITRKS